MQVIVVTGTNGKTTTAHIIAAALFEAGIQCAANSSGANLLSGITAELCCNASLSEKPLRRYAVIECDEGALKQAVPLLHPRVIVVTNLFRDQPDRFGSVLNALSAIRKGIKKAPEAVLCLNADCSLTSSLPFTVHNPIRYYGLNCAADRHRKPDHFTAERCIRCGEEYQYHFHTYAHLGGFYCPNCGYQRRKPQISVEKIRELNLRYSVVSMRTPDEKKEVKVRIPALYNVYNACAAVCGYLAFAECVNRKGRQMISREQIFKSLGTVRPAFGRMEIIDLGGVKLQMILVKNSAGCNQVISWMSNMDEPYELVICLNDHIADGRDISWIWDTDYERLAEDNRLLRVYVLGDRAKTLQNRLRCAGLPEDKISRPAGYRALIKEIKGKKVPVFAIPNYTAMLEMRRFLG